MYHVCNENSPQSYAHSDTLCIQLSSLTAARSTCYLIDVSTVMPQKSTSYHNVNANVNQTPSLVGAAGPQL